MPAATIDPECELPAVVAEVVACYARTIYDVRHFAHGSYTVGDAPRVSFPLLSAVPPDPLRFPLADWHDGALVVRFTADMRGELVEADRRSSLDELIASGRAAPIDGAFALAIGPHDRAVIAVDAVTFELRSVPAARPPAYASGFRWDWWRHALAMLLLLAVLMALAFHQPRIADAIHREQWPETTAFVGYVMSPHEIETVRDRPRLPPPRRTGIGQPNHDGESGVMGKPSAKARRGHAAVARRPPPADSHAYRFNPDLDTQGGDHIGLYGSWPGHFVVSPHGLVEQPSDDMDFDLWAGFRGAPRESYGIGGLGARDTGRGASGWRRPGAHGHGGYGQDGVPRIMHAGTRWRDVGVIGPLRQADVRRVIAWRRAALRRCGPLGAARVQFAINGAGLVKLQAITPGSPRETRAANCVAEHLRRMWFPRGVGTLQVTYPLPAP